MKKIPINKNILLLLTLVVLAVAGYFIFFRGEEEPLTSTESIPTVGGELVVELNRLKALRNIDGDLFKDPSFKTLVDITQPVTPQPLGRSNPFLPFGAN